MIESTCGVIVARFQVPFLTKGHLSLIGYVAARCRKVILFLGVSPTRNSKRNPIPFAFREQMICDNYDNLTIIPLLDNPSDEAWSKQLDNEINKLLAPGQTAILYGSRDCFKDRYSGTFSVSIVPEAESISGTDLRKEIFDSARYSSDFNKGLIYASMMRFPTCYPTVDVAIIREDDPALKYLLLGRKPGEKLWRFPGGFADPKSDSYEIDARREVLEETGLEVDQIEYVGSLKVNDWRYRNEDDCIKTLVFKAKYIFGPAKAADDLEEVRWFLFRDVKPEIINPTHIKIFEMLKFKGVL